MKIKGWEKISGFTYKGYSITNPIHNAEETKYEATILNLNLPQKPKWELAVLTPAHKFKSDDTFSIFIKDDENRSTITNLHKERMQSIVYFRCTFEEMIDKSFNNILQSAHPSGLSAMRGFFGCGHFKKINEDLKKMNRKPIKWLEQSLPHSDMIQSILNTIKPEDLKILTDFYESQNDFELESDKFCISTYFQVFSNTQKIEWI
jgi:glutamate racemase